MSYQRTVTFQINAESLPDAADLRALLLDAAGDDVGATFGDFVSLGGGFYMGVCTDVPDIHVGAIRVHDVADDTVALAVIAVNSADDPCHAEHSGCAGIGTGSGSLEVAYCLKNAITAAAIEGATVEVYSDADRLDRVAVGVTDDDGNVTFNLDPGTYYFFRYKSGVTFDDPYIRTVS